MDAATGDAGAQEPPDRARPARAADWSTGDTLGIGPRPPVPIGATHGADLFLARACEEAAEAAWGALESRYFAGLRALLRRRGASPAEAAEVIRDLPDLLRAPPIRGGARTRLGAYDGRASLFAFLAVVALRRLADRRRERAPEVLSRIATWPAPEPAPLTRLLPREEAAALEAALAEALRTLAPAERLALQLRHRDGLSEGGIAAVLGVGEARARDLLESGRRCVVDRVRGARACAGEAAQGLGPALETAFDHRVREPGSSSGRPSDTP
jgi:RNA polymerase sigma-70 factor (ECF subfamily)